MGRFRNLIHRRNATIGNRGERIAARFLRRHDYRILERNLRQRFAEVDLMALSPDRQSLVLVEVKTAVEPDMLPELRVDVEKMRHLHAMARQLSKLSRRPDLPVRFEIIGVNMPLNGKISIRHQRDIA